jgi:hypothetical protein
MRILLLGLLAASAAHASDVTLDYTGDSMFGTTTKGGTVVATSSKSFSGTYTGQLVFDAESVGGQEQYALDSYNIELNGHELLWSGQGGAAPVIDPDVNGSGQLIGADIFFSGGTAANGGASHTWVTIGDSGDSYVFASLRPTHTPWDPCADSYCVLTHGTTASNSQPGTWTVAAPELSTSGLWSGITFAGALMLLPRRRRAEVR